MFFFTKKRVLKKRPKKDPPFEHFLGPQKASKSGPRRIFGGFGGGPKKGTPYRGPKIEILLLFTTFQLGPGSQKGTPFRDHVGKAPLPIRGPVFPKIRKKGVPEKRSKKNPFLSFFWGPHFETEIRKMGFKKKKIVCACW